MRLKPIDVELKMNLPLDRFKLAIFTTNPEAVRFKNRNYRGYGNGTMGDITIYHKKGRLRNSLHKPSIWVYVVVGGHRI